MLLGKFNAQGLGTDHNFIIRCLLYMRHRSCYYGSLTLRVWELIITSLSDVYFTCVIAGDIGEV